MPTTTLTTDFKTSVMQAAHNWNATVTPTGSTSSGSASVTSVSSLTGVSVGSPISGSGIPGSTVIAALPTTTSLTLSQNATASAAGVTLTVTGDVFKVLLIKSGFSGVYDATLANVGTPGSSTPTTTNVGTDETSGSGYSSGGVALTNTTPANAGGVGYTTPGANPSWSSATFSTVAAVVYNTGARTAGLTNRTVGVYDLGGTSSVSSGTFTLLMPTNSSAAALIRIS